MSPSLDEVEAVARDDDHRAEAAQFRASSRLQVGEAEISALHGLPSLARRESIAAASTPFQRLADELGGRTALIRGLRTQGLVEVVGERQVEAVDARQPCVSKLQFNKLQDRVHMCTSCRRRIVPTPFHIARIALPSEIFPTGSKK